MSRWDSLKPSNTESAAGKNKPQTSRRRQHNQNQLRSGDDSSRYHHRTKGVSSTLPKSSRGKVSPPFESALRALKTSVSQQQNNLERGNDFRYHSQIESSLEEIEASIIDYPSTEKIGIFSLCIEVLDKGGSSNNHLEKLIESILEKMFSDKPPQLSEKQTCRGVSVLSHKYQTQENTTFLRPLALLVQSGVHALPAEGTARTVVGGILLPSLEKPSMTVDNKLLILHAVSGLLADSQHASALLSSLVQDVTNDGTEHMVVNPLRPRLIMIIQKLLQNPDEQPNVTAVSCQTLSKIIVALSKLDPNCVFSTTFIDLPTVESFVLTAFGQRRIDFLEPCLLLLHALLLYHPNHISKLISKLVLTPDWDGCKRNNACKRCNIKLAELGIFKQCVHFQTSPDLGIEISVSNLAVICLAECIKSMPWKRWLGLHVTTSSLSGFGRRLADSLVVIINIIRCNFTSCKRDESAESLSHLAKQTFQEIPFGFDDNVTERAIDLLLTIADIAFGNGRTPKLKETALSVLIHTMGGWETPTGETVQMCLPTKRWLSKTSSVRFLESSFKSVKSNDKNAEISTKFLVAVFRTRPETVLKMQAQFLETINLGQPTNDSSTRLRVLSLLEAYMLGRKTITCESEGLPAESTLRVALSILKQSRDDKSVQVRCLAFNTYAALMEKDWIAIERDGGEALNDHFCSIVFHCQATNTKVKRSACKALAEFCTSYFSARKPMIGGNKEDTKTALTAQIVSDTMLKIMEDENAAVRAVAHFCIGNLAYSIRETNSGSLLNDSTLFRMCTNVQQALHDQNDKVTGNAIRAIGHCGFLLLLRENLRDDEWDESANLHRLIVQSLKVKLSRAISLVSEERQSMTWRQRSVAKKHGWGAANAMSLLFQHANLDETNVIFEEYVEVLRLLMVCVGKASVLNEKIAVSAMAAIRSLPPNQLSKLTGKSDLVGDGIGICTLRLFVAQENKSSTSDKVLEEYHILLRHLLACATVTDASVTLRVDGFSNSVLRFLYTWMVTNESDSNAFQIFAQALRPGLWSQTDDVLLEQNFASRALQRNKKGTTDTNYNSEDDDDADEL